jgi:hypothetical protein
MIKYLSISQILFLSIVNDFLFISLFTHIVFNLFNYNTHKFFYLNLDFFNYKNTLKNPIYTIFFYKK